MIVKTFLNFFILCTPVYGEDNKLFSKSTDDGPLYSSVTGEPDYVAGILNLSLQFEEMRKYLLKQYGITVVSRGFEYDHSIAGSFACYKQLEIFKDALDSIAENNTSKRMGINFNFLVLEKVTAVDRIIHNKLKPNNLAVIIELDFEIANYAILNFFNTADDISKNKSIFLKVSKAEIEEYLQNKENGLVAFEDLHNAN